MQKIIIICFTISISLNSCIVSKKKYDAALLKNESLSNKLDDCETQNKNLEIKVNSLITDFEKMKSDLHLSNAIKSDEMSELFVKVTQLTDDNVALKKELDETLNLYKSQKQTSQSVSSELKNLTQENNKLKSDTASIKYALKLSKERLEKLKLEYDDFKLKYNSLSAKNRELKKDKDFTNSKLISFEKQLISNQEKLEDISDAFIKLRKELLSAKSANKTIDPNKNANIDKIAKQLGHY